MSGTNLVRRTTILPCLANHLSLVKRCFSLRLYASAVAKYDGSSQVVSNCEINHRSDGDFPMLATITASQKLNVP